MSILFIILSIFVISLVTITCVFSGLLLRHTIQTNKQRIRTEFILDQLQHDTKTIHQEIIQHVQQGQITLIQQVHDSIHKSMHDIREQISLTLKHNSDAVSQQINQLTQRTDLRLQEISSQVDKRLAEGFEKTTATFTDVVKRLALIDQAQKKITELSSNVVSLQEILIDKRSRGTFGEIQLNALIKNVMPEHHFSMQHTLSNGKRADCILFLPEPTGHIVIDAKFPLETFRLLTDDAPRSVEEKRRLQQQFRQDIRKHIQDIATKYIIPGETADGAMMFIPAEAIFAEIHAHYADLVEYAQQARVWLVSPTTMMAILTAARSVLKDAATRKQIHIIQEHLGYLAKDFERFAKRMENLARHIKQAHHDVDDVNTSAKKLTSRFQKIEMVELEES